MKATLEFTLPEEEVEHLDALQGSQAKRVILEVLNMLRDASKYRGQSVTDIDELRTFIHSACTAYGVTLE